jgi:two-component system chemotaxis response regulator CheY
MPIQVLLVEDSRAMRNYVASILEGQGSFEVDQVANGFDALRALPRTPYGLIVTDVNMPDVNGIELSRFVRRTPRHVDTPLVVISTDGSDVDRERALGAGASAFLAKPFEPEELLAVVRQVLEAAGVAMQDSPATEDQQ